MSTAVMAGSEATIAFAKTATDETPLSLDLNRLLVQHPAATFYMVLSGDELEQLGWGSGDIVVIDRSLTPSVHELIVAVVEGEFRLCRFKRTLRGNQLVTISGQPVDSEAADLWGVVTHVIHKYA